MNLNLEILKEFIVPVIVLLCLIIGYCIKHIPRFSAVSNAYIPTILAMIGAVAYCYHLQKITLIAIVAGSFSGLVAVGLHQTFSQLIDKNLNNYKIDPSHLAAAKEDVDAVNSESVPDDEECKDEDDESEV